MAECKEEIKKKHKWKILPHSSDIPFLLMIFPALVITVIFAYFPMMGLLVAFKDYVPKLGIFNSQWASSFGFQNFIDIFETPGLVDAIWNTFFLNILSLVVNFPMPIIFALLLEEVKNRAFKAGCQTISYLPHFLSMVAVTGISLNLISEYGMINDLLHAVTGERIIFMGDENWFVPIYIIIVTWKGMGWNSIVYLSALSGISPELYEAAKIDGAGRFKQVIYITLPSLVPTMMILLILNLGSVFGSNFDLVYGLQNDIAWNKEVISTVVYKYGINEGEYGLSTALGLMQGVIALILTLGSNWVSKKLSSVSMW